MRSVYPLRAVGIGARSKHVHACPPDKRYRGLDRTSLASAHIRAQQWARARYYAAIRHSAIRLARTGWWGGRRAGACNVAPESGAHRLDAGSGPRIRSSCAAGRSLVRERGLPSVNRTVIRRRAYRHKMAREKTYSVDESGYKGLVETRAGLSGRRQLLAVQEDSIDGNLPAP